MAQAELARIRSALAMMAQAASPFTITWKVKEESANKMRWLKRGGRDFEKITAPLLREMGKAYRAAAIVLLKSKRPTDPKAPWQAAADVYRDRVVSRLRTGGGDVKADMRKLSPEYVKRKGFSRIGYLTGKLLRDLSNSKVTVKRA